MKALKIFVLGLLLFYSAGAFVGSVGLLYVSYSKFIARCEGKTWEPPQFLQQYLQPQQQQLQPVKSGNTNGKKSTRHVRQR